MSVHGIEILQGKEENKNDLESLMRIFRKRDPLKNREFHGHTEIVWTCCISSDNQHLFSGSADCLIKIWDVKSGDPIGKLEGHTNVVYIINITPDDRRLVSGGWDCLVIIWDWVNNIQENIIHSHTNQVYALAISSDNKFLLSGGADKFIRIWDFENKQEIAEISFGIYIFGITLTCDNKKIIAAGGQEKYGIYDFDTHALISEHFPTAGIIQSIALTPDNKFLAFGTQKNLIKVYNYPANTEYCTFTSHENQVRNVVFTSDNTYLISTSSDKTIKIFNIVTKVEILTLDGSGGYIYGQFLSRDGQFLATCATDKIVSLWRIGDKIRLKKLSGHAAAMRCHTITNDSKFVFTGSDDKTIKKWDIEKGTLVSEIRGLSGNVMALLVTEDLKYIINAGEDTKVNVWDYNTNELVVELSLEVSFVACLAATKDNKFFASGGGDMKISLWDLSTLTLIKRLEGHTNAVFAVVFSNDGQSIISGSADKTFRVWDVNNLGISIKFETSSAMINTIAISSDNSFLALGCRDKCAYLWDWKEKVLLNTFARHTGWVQGVFFSNDEQSLVTAGMDTIARVWNTTEERLEYELKGHTSSVRWAEFTKDGKYIITVGHDKLVNIWDIQNIGELELADIGGPIDSFLYLTAIEKKTKPEKFNSKALFSPLKVNIAHIYCYLDRPELLREAFEIGVDIRRDNNGNSPLHYALVRKSQGCIDIILEFLTKLKSKDFKLFLNYSYALRGDLEPLLHNYSEFLPDFLEAIFFKISDTISFAGPRYMLPHLHYSKGRRLDPYNFVFHPYESNGTIEVPVQFKTMPFPISYVRGSTGSMELLDSIMNCTNKQILQSEFVKTYIRDKWDSMWKFILALTIITWTNILLMIILISLYSQGKTGTLQYIVLIILFLVTNAFLTVYEVCQLFTNGVKYFQNAWNFIDFLRISLCLTWIVLSFLDSENYIKYVTWPMTLVNFFRGLSGFRAFDETRFYTRLIVKAFVESIAFLLVFFYSTLAFGILYISANQGLISDIGSIWTISYELSMGNFDNSGMGQLEYTGFMLATIINVIVILNLLIAILGNSFDSFQAQAGEIDCLDMTEFVLELETLIFWRRSENNKKYLKKCEDMTWKGETNWEGRLKAILNAISDADKRGCENYAMLQKSLSEKTESISKQNTEVLEKIKLSNEEIKKLVSESKENFEKSFQQILANTPNK